MSKSVKSVKSDVNVPFLVGFRPVLNLFWASGPWLEGALNPSSPRPSLSEAGRPWPYGPAPFEIGRRFIQNRWNP